MSSHPHPDTGVRHAVIHNNLALRQHRDFSEDDLVGAINVGVFGDSYTENLRLPSPYSFGSKCWTICCPKRCMGTTQGNDSMF